jgi:hypothetical protein
MFTLFVDTLLVLIKVQKFSQQRGMTIKMTQRRDFSHSRLKFFLLLITSDTFRFVKAPERY